MLSNLRVCVCVYVDCSSEMDADTLRAHKQWKKGIMIVWRHAAQHKLVYAISIYYQVLGYGASVRMRKRGIR